MEEKRVRTTDTGHYRAIFFFVVMIIVAVIVISLQGKDSINDPSNTSRSRTGLPAPTFTFPALDGKTVSLTDFKGKVVFVNIWATWCPTCREEMPSMEKLYQELKGENFEILAVSIDKSGAKAVAPFVKANGLSFPVLLDPEGTIQKPYGITGVPESFIIGKKGIIEKIIIGPIDWAAPEVVRFFRNLIQRP